MSKKTLVFCALFAFSSTAMSIPGLSRIIPKDLSDSDIQMMMDHARNKMDGKPEGAVLTWTNPETRNTGKVTLLRAFQIRGNSCREILHFVDIANDMDNFTYRTTICKTSSGDWVPL